MPHFHFNLFHSKSHPHHDMVYGQDKNKENFTHEIIAGAAGFEAMRLLEDHIAKTEGIPVGSNHSILREALAAFAAAEIERIVEEHQLRKQYDVEKLKADAAANALKHYDESYGHVPTGAAALFDFRVQYGMYAEYHDNKINQLIHTIFVPTLLWSAFAIVSCLSPSFSAWPLDQFGIPLNLTLFVAIGYAAYYAALHPALGGSLGVLVLGGLFAADQFALNGSKLIGVEPLPVAVGIHVVSWIIQFIGHGIFEKRAPALLDHPIQAIVLAPLFVWSHHLFNLGLFQQEKVVVEAEAAHRLTTYRASLEKKKEE